jgi:hypothetical protein
MRTTVDNVERRDRKLDIGVTSEISDVLPERDGLGAGTGAADGKGDTKDSVGTKLGLGPAPLVRSTIELLNHLLVDHTLLDRVHADEGGAEDLVDVINSLGDTLAHVVLATVAKLEGLELTGGSARGDAGSVNTNVGGDLDLNSRVTARIEDLTSLDAGDGDGLLELHALSKIAERISRTDLADLVDEDVELLSNGVILKIVGNDSLLFGELNSLCDNGEGKNCKKLISTEILIDGRSLWIRAQK